MPFCVKLMTAISGKCPPVWFWLQKLEEKGEPFSVGTITCNFKPSCCLSADQARAPGGANWERGVQGNLIQSALKIQECCHSLSEVGMAEVNRRTERGVNRRNGVINSSQISSGLEGTEKGQGLEQKLL